MTPQLRLFVTPEEIRDTTSRGLSPQMTLREFFEAHCVPKFHAIKADEKIETAHARTRRDYRTTLDKWEAYTPDPPLVRIDEALCEEFLAKVEAEAGRLGELLAGHTLKKHATNLRTMLRRAGPKRDDVKDGKKHAALLSEVPCVFHPEIEKVPVKPYLTLNQRAAVWKATDLMTAPRIANLDVPHWWRVTIRTMYELGTRCEESFDMEWEHLSLQDDGKQLLHIPPRFRKGRQKPLYAFVPDDLVAEWRTLRRGQSKLILRTINPRTLLPFDPRYLYECWQTLLRKAGIQNPKGAKKKYGYGWHSIRRTHANSIDPRLAQLTLGHSDFITTITHYQEAQVTAEKLKAELPPFWRNVRDSGDEPASEAG